MVIELTDTDREVLRQLKEFPVDSSGHRLICCLRKLGSRRMFFFDGDKILKVGKSECEPNDWRAYYEKLVALGLIKFAMHYQQGKGMKNGGPSISGYVDTTEYGYRIIAIIDQEKVF